MPFEKGKSGNPDGRPRGSRNKALTDNQIMEELGKGSQVALNTLKNIMISDDSSDSLKSKVALGWIKADRDMREFLLKAKGETRQTYEEDARDDGIGEILGEVISLTMESQ